MVETTILDEVLKELKRAKKKHPQWPEHIVSKAAIVCEESGELVRACLNWKYERAELGTPEYQNQIYEIRKEAIHTAATALRFLQDLNF